MAVLLSCQSLTKAYGSRPLFHDISLGVGDNERMGLIGPNGAGKSTLLRIFAGEEKPDSGIVSPRRGLRVAYITQEDTFPEGGTVESVLTGVLAGLPLEATEKEVRIEIALGKVGFTQRDQAVETMSGGWKKRLSLARALVQEAELLLIDEPTNHLDLEGVLWLEGLLKEASFAFVLISHDRVFPGKCGLARRRTASPICRRLLERHGQLQHVSGAARRVSGRAGQSAGCAGKLRSSARSNGSSAGAGAFDEGAGAYSAGRADD